MTTKDEAGGYAVLAPLVERAGVPHLLFEVRADTLRRQPGEVCFPGGKIEPGETAVGCALRETEEELGIAPAAVRVLAPLEAQRHRDGFIISPVLARVDAAAVAAMSPSPVEVKETLLVPLDFFTRHPPEAERFQWAGHTIWGLTGRIVRAVLEMGVDDAEP